jgi:hypothetical protein
MTEFYATEDAMRIGIAWDKSEPTMKDVFALSPWDKFLVVMNTFLTALGGYRMMTLIQAPTVWEQWIWQTVIFISGSYSILYFMERRVIKSRIPSAKEIMDRIV